jgi:hypothetical protein
VTVNGEWRTVTSAKGCREWDALRSRRLAGSFGGAGGSGCRTGREARQEATVKPNRGGPIRLTDTNQEHLGFILMAGDGYPLDAAEFEGDCVFMPLPQNPALFEERPYLLLAEHRDAGEHCYRMLKDGSTLRFTIGGPLDREVVVAVGEDGWGEWGCRSGGDQERIGFAHRVQAGGGAGRS